MRICKKKSAQTSPRVNLWMMSVPLLCFLVSFSGSEPAEWWWFFSETRLTWLLNWWPFYSWLACSVSLSLLPHWLLGLVLFFEHTPLTTHSLVQFRERGYKVTFISNKYFSESYEVFWREAHWKPSLPILILSFIAYYYINILI